MSSAGGIYIGYFQVGEVKIYAVAEMSAIDNLDYYDDEDASAGIDRNSGEYAKYVRTNWGKGPFFSTEEKAREFAAISDYFSRNTEDGVRMVGKFKCQLTDGRYVKIPPLDTWKPLARSNPKPVQFFRIWNGAGVEHSHPTCTNFEEAKEEARRLAKQHPDTKFHVLQSVYSVSAKVDTILTED